MAEHYGQQDSMQANEQALSVALHLAEAGIKVFPAQSNGAPAPGFKWKDDATDDAHKLRTYFLQLYPDTATTVGMPCGLNDLVVIDPDAKNGTRQGVEEFNKIIQERGVDLSRIPVIDTPSGGKHYIFQQAANARVGCGRGELHKHIDVKGDGGYVIAVGSIRDGKQYKQAEGTLDFVTLFSAGMLFDLPQGLRDVIAKPRLATLDGKHIAEGMSIDLVREALRQIANDFDAREDWVAMAHAIYGATHGSVEGMEAFLEWSYTHYQTDGEPERVWESITSADVRAGAGMIRRELERRGCTELLHKAQQERAQHLFDDDPDDPEAPKPKEPKDYMKGVWFDGDSLPAPSPHLVEDLVTAQGLVILGGQSGAGKTFVAVNLTTALTTGAPFFGKETFERCGVIYIAAEGRTTIAPRLAAAKIGMFADDNLPVAVLTDAPDLSGDAERKQFINKVVKPVAEMIRERHGVRVGAVIIDTFASAFSMKDENAAGEIALLCRRAEQIGRSIDAVTIGIHHYGKDAETGLRGSSNFRALGEKVLAVMVNRNNNVVSNRRLVIVKNRDGEEGEAYRFDLQTVPLGVDPRTGRPFNAARVHVLGQAEQQREDTDERPGRLLQAMIAEPRSTQQRWGEMMGGVSKQSVNDLLQRLQKDKLAVQSAGDHRWSVTRKGEKYVDDLSQNEEEEG